MPETEKFSLFKFAGSFFQFLPWVKTLRYAAGIALIGFVGLTIYRAFFMPTQTTKQVTHIIAQPGSQVTRIRKDRKRKSGIEVGPFVEGIWIRGIRRTQGRRRYKAGVRG